MNVFYLVIGIGILLIIGAIVSLVFGIRFLIKYAKTRKTKDLILGLLLTFVIPGIIILLIFWFYVIPSVMSYMPGPLPDPNMVYMPGPQ